MPVNGPTEIEIECDEYGETLDVASIEYAGGEGPTWGPDPDTARTEGWVCRPESNEVVCPACRGKEQ